MVEMKDEVDCSANGIPVQPIVYPWLSDVYNHIVSLFNANKMPSVLLLHGVKGTGKSNLAMQLAADILKNPSELHYNLNIVSGQNSIKVDEIRSIIVKSHSTNLYNTNKVNIILNIEQLTEAAANALLKTLESTNNSIFIFTSDNYDSVKPTILSRCHKINISITKYLDAVHLWLNQQGVEELVSQKLLLDLVAYAPLRALSFYNSGYLEKLNQLRILMSGLNNCNIVSSSSEVVKIFTCPTFKIDEFLIIINYLLCKDFFSEKFVVNYETINLINNYKKRFAEGLTIDPFSLVYKLLYRLVL